MRAWLAIAASTVAIAASCVATAQVDRAGGSAVDVARNVRSHGCGTSPGVRTMLRGNVALNGAALRWSYGTSLKSAIDSSGYRDEQSAALHVTGDASALRQALALNLCKALTDASFIDIGSAQRGRDTWLIVATPFAPPPAVDAGDVSLELLQRINAARAQSRHCGRVAYPPAPPLRLNAQLTRAAQLHARDMLDHDYFAHDGRDGSTPSRRVAAAGYQFRMVGENIAFGPDSAAEAVQGWLESPSHCENIMDQRFSDSGIAFAANTRGKARVYWVQDFAAPR